MKNQATAQMQEPMDKENVYTKYIIPLVDNAQSGEELLYISPSTFFGYYTIGAHNFELVCNSLKEARNRGVEVKLIIDAHDCLTAKAAEGLLSFLVDGTEIKNLEGNTDIYYLLVYNKTGSSRLIEFTSERPTALAFLPNAQIRPYGRVKQFIESMDSRDADSIRAQFYHIWENTAQRVGNTIYKYMPGYQMRKQMVFVQSFTYLLVFTLGLVVGIIFSLQQQPQVDPKAVIFWLIATLGTGVIGTWLSTQIMNKFQG